MEANILAFSATCEKQITVPDNYLLYCSERYVTSLYYFPFIPTPFIVMTLVVPSLVSFPYRGLYTSVQLSPNIRRIPKLTTHLAAVNKTPANLSLPPS